ncbi:helix-turn-helix transcriptional regulator [Ensifer soli]|uniref:helix-turn-helix transcriptional regulator n=1 Tax=Ciceribacter sp. sgz301302 TaxID=3342379 RepID=UPI0035B9E225
MEVSRIYEAAALPELWPVVLDAMTRRTGAFGCTLITVDEDIPIWMSSPDCAPTCNRYHLDGWAARNPRVDYSMRHRPPGFVRDIDIFSREEIAAMPLIRDFFIPAGGGWGAGLMIPMPSGETLVFSVDKAWKDGPLTDDAMAFLEEMRPHLSRAALLTAKLRFERARAVVAGFDVAGIPAALIRADGGVLAANDRFQALDPPLRIGARDRLHVEAETVQALLTNALQRLVGRDFRMPMSFPLTGGREPMVLHLIPSAGEARDLFGHAVALLLVSLVRARSAPDRTLIAALFDLTPGEARVAGGIAGGQSPAEIATRHNVSRETVRAQLRAIFRKTGTTSQAALIRRLRIDLGDPTETQD